MSRSFFLGLMLWTVAFDFTHGAVCSGYTNGTDIYQLCKIFAHINNLPSYWLFTGDICTWGAPVNELNCTAGNGLIEFDLSGKNLSGTLNLNYNWPANLTYINVANNDLQADWSPSHYSLLPSTLEYLDISDNQFKFGTPFFFLQPINCIMSVTKYAIDIETELFRLLVDLFCCFLMFFIVAISFFLSQWND